MDVDAYRILSNAELAALDEIVCRSVAIGRAIERCAPSDEFDALPSIYAAVDAYYTARRAVARIESER